MQRWVGLGVAALIAGCGGSGGGASGTISPGARAPAVAGVVRPAAPGTAAPPGTLVHALGPVVGAPTLEALAESVEDSVELDGEGRFTLQPSGPGPRRVLVSAPGAALLWADADADVPLELALQPEARAQVHLRGPDGAPEVLAVVLVLDAAGAPLPVSPVVLVRDEGGRLEVGRLPGGTFEVVALSCDLTRGARGALEVRAGARAGLELTLGDDPPLLARVLRLAGPPELAALAGGEAP